VSDDPKSIVHVEAPQEILAAIQLVRTWMSTRGALVAGGLTDSDNLAIVEIKKRARIQGMYSAAMIARGYDVPAGLKHDPTVIHAASRFQAANEIAGMIELAAKSLEED